MRKFLISAFLLVLTLVPLILTACQGGGSSKFVGTYQAVLPSATTDGWRVTLNLNDDDTATLLNDYMNGEPPVVESGTWISENDTATVILSETEGESREQAVKITFQLYEDRLFAVDFEPEDYLPSVGVQLKKQ
jgi:uncharacterized lipoprotein NlpE involved in copper resistance